MTAPSSTYTELVTTTLNNYRDKLSDNVATHNPLLDRLKKKGNADTATGGLKLLENLMYAQNSTVLWYSAWQQTDSGGRGIRADDADTHDQDLAAAINTSLQKDGANKPTANIDWGGYLIQNLGGLASATEASIASSATTDVLGAASLFVSITGTVTITSLGTGAKAPKFARFAGILTLTHNATTLILPTGANITTAAGDTMVVISDASSNARVIAYQRADGTPLAAPALANDLAALEALASTGIATRTASNTWAQRSVAAGAGIAVSNGDGVSGNPTIAADLGKQSIWVPSGAMKARTTNGAASGTVEMATNKNMFSTLDFDTTTQEFAQVDIRMPKSWNEGTVTFIPVWSHASTTTNFGVVWGLDAIAISDNEAGDVAFGTAQTSADTGGTTNNIYQGPESSAITVAGSPAAGDLVQFRIHRDPSNGSDTMAIDARLHGILILYTIDTLKDD